MNIAWSHIEDGLVGLTGNPATALVFKLLGVAASVSGVNAKVDMIQAFANELIDTVQAGVVPEIRANEPRHMAAIALAAQGIPVPAEVPKVEPAAPPAAEEGA